MRCILENCNSSYWNNQHKLSFHRFPVKEEKQNLWKQQLGLDLTCVIPPKSNVCSQHFRPEDIIKKFKSHKARYYLRAGAVPVLHPIQHPRVKEEKTVCRLCLSSRKALKCVLDKTYEGISYLNIYFEVVGIPLTDYPSFPWKICKHCDVKLIRAYNFLEKCSETEEYLKRLQDEGNQDVSDEFIQPIYLEGKNETLTSEITIEQEIKEEAIEEPPRTTDEEMKVASGISQNLLERDEEMTIKQEIKEEVIEEPTELPEVTETESSAANENCSTLSETETSNEMKYIKCKKCTKICKGMEVFRKHVCAPKRKELLCPPNQDSKESYSKKVTLEKDFDQYHKNEISCSLCNLKFRTYQHQRIHKQMAHPEKPTFQCAHCGKKFTRKMWLIQHINGNHLDLTEFECEICGKNVKTLMRMYNHMRSSHPENKHQCQICWKEFNSKQHMNVHLRIHEKRLYICPICPESPDSVKYSDIRSVKLHINKIHPAMKHLYEFEK